MTKYTLAFPFFFLTHILLISNNALAVTFYENNFETGAMPKSFPNVETGQMWTLPKKFPNVFGKGNHFSISDTSPHSGAFCLRFTYEARNGFCNTCGHKSDKHIESGHDNADYFISKKGRDLSIADNPTTKKKDDGIKAEPGKIVYNRDGGYSKWEIMSIADQNAANDRLNLKLNHAGIHGEKTINGGDRIAVTRQCGVDGIIGMKKGKNDIKRRSDCNNVIMWFAGVTAQNPGDSIYRRQYLKAVIDSLGVRQKLHYLRPDRKGPFQGEIVLFGQSAIGKIEPELSGVEKYGNALPIYKPHTAEEFSGLAFKRNVWYYIEEQYKAATVKTTNIDGTVAQYNNDGEYRLWFAETGSEPTNKNSPTLELTGLKLPPIIGGKGTHISFWGNTQHNTDNQGSWYIDDVKITDTWNGPVTKAVDGTTTSNNKTN